MYSSNLLNYLTDFETVFLVDRVIQEEGLYDMQTRVKPGRVVSN
jgi:hypothetical protein